MLSIAGGILIAILLLIAICFAFSIVTLPIQIGAWFIEAKRRKQRLPVPSSMAFSDEEFQDR